MRWLLVLAAFGVFCCNGGGLPSSRTVTARALLNMNSFGRFDYATINHLAEGPGVLSPFRCWIHHWNLLLEYFHPRFQRLAQ
jgi:hypothetical protein